MADTITRIPAMTQITDEMVSAALDLQHEDGTTPEAAMRAALEAALAVREKDSDGLTDDQIAYCHERADRRRAEWRNDLVARLRGQRPALGIVDSGVPIPIMYQAADLIERQAEEIVKYRRAADWNEDLAKEANLEIERLTAERDDLKHDIERHLKHISGYEAERTELIEREKKGAVLIGELASERKELIEALREMVDTQQSWEDSVSKIVGRPVIPFARAIDRARALLERLGAVIRD